MRKLTAVLFLIGTFCSISNVVAQETYGLKGTVVDADSNAIESGNLIVLNPADSSVIKGIHFWEGQFELYGIEPRNVILRFTSDGLMDVYLTQSFDSDVNLVDLGKVKMADAIQNLDGVEIIYRKPMYTREVGKLVVNVEGTILSERGTILELLKSAPNVIVRSDGGVSVAGKGNAIVYLDGQRVISMDMLSAMSSDLVSKIEIIENPSSRYDAQGNAVIEIITKSGALNGYQGNIGLRGMKRTESQVAYWGNFQYRKDWFSMYASVGQYSGAVHEVEQYYRDVYGANPVQMENDVDKRYNHKFDTWGYLDFDFRLDSLNTLFINYAITKLKSEVNIDNVNLIYDNETFLGDLNSDSKGEQNNMMHSVSGGYIHTLDTLNSEISLTGQYTNFNIEGNNQITQISDFGSPVTSYFRNDNTNAIRVYSGNLDYVKNWSDKIKLNLGAK
ncbi:MAG: outer membrane beta-barrel protein, partial [Crocinitomicaceae bacterium]